MRQPGMLLKLASVLVLFLAGFMIAASASTSGGQDLRPARNTNLIDLVQKQAQRNKDLQQQVATLRQEIRELSGQQSQQSSAELDALRSSTGMTPVRGPAVRVTLDDAPLSVQPPGVDDDLLVVHQQDIQMVVNVLWEAGAEAMTIQGQRVTTLTGIKCVGNTVVLHGVPYAPPYEITAIGDQQDLVAALDNSAEVAVYRQYTEAYSLGYAQQTVAVVTMPAYRGSLELGATQAG